MNVSEEISYSVRIGKKKQFLPGNTPDDVHKNSTSTSTSNDLLVHSPGDATQCPLSQYGVFPVQFTDNTGVSMCAAHTWKGKANVDFRTADNT